MVFRSFTPDSGPHWTGRSHSYRSLLAVISAVALLIPAGLASPAAAAGGHGDIHLSASVLAAPRPVPATDQRVHLVYEILLQNVSEQPIRLDRLVVRDADRPRVLAVHDGRAVERRLVGFATGGFTRTLGPGEAGVLLLDVTLPAGTGGPAGLTHRFGLSVGPAGAARPLTITGAPTEVDQREPLRLSPPLSGSELAVIGCCGPPFAHRQALFDLGSEIVIAQRYAVDFVRLDGGVSSFTGDPARNESYFIFGDEVVAAAPGEVLAVRDGVPENTPPESPPNPGPEDLTGNYVLQDLGGGYAAMYAHLQTGSVQVRAGDRLDRGQLLGRVGNTGNSSEPHLHLHVTDGPGLPSGMAAEGVPFVFDRFRFGGRLAGLDSEPPAPVRVPAPPPHRRAGQYPLTGDVVEFR